MTTLLPPLTVIAHPAASAPLLPSSSYSSPAEDGSGTCTTDISIDTSCTCAANGIGKEDTESRPPLATWYDEPNRLFIGLLDDTDACNTRTAAGDANIANNCGTCAAQVEGESTNASSSSQVSRRVVARFQTYSIPDDRRMSSTANGAQNSLVPRSSPIRVVLPNELMTSAVGSSSCCAEEVDGSENDTTIASSQDDIDADATDMEVGETPILLAKLSLDGKYMALQFSSTLVRVVRIDSDSDQHGQGKEHQRQATNDGKGEGQRKVRDIECSELGNGDDVPTTAAAKSPAHTPRMSRYQRQWTIDLSLSLEPMLSDPDAMPRNKNKKSESLSAAGNGAAAAAAAAAGATAVAGAAALHHARRLLSNRRLPGLANNIGTASSFSEHDANTGGAGEGETSNFILPGGMLWIDRPSDSHPVMVLVTTHCIQLYKIHPTRHAMRKLETHRYPSSMPVPAASFWYESGTRTLAVGNFVRHNDDGNTVVGLELSLYVFDRKRNVKKASSITTIISPVVLGQERLCYTDIPSQDDRNDNDDNAISLDDISLVSAYGEVFLIELKGGQAQRGVNLYKVDRAQKRITNALKLEIPSECPVMGDASSTIVATVDSLLVIINRESITSLFVDVAPVHDEEDVPYHCTLLAGDDDCLRIMGDAEISFLPPRYLLDPLDRGSLHEISFDLEELIQSTPPSSYTVPFILRRRIDSLLSRQLALECVNTMLLAEDSNLSILCEWIESLGDAYAQGGQEVATFDYKACLPLIPAAALLSSDRDTNPLMPQDDIQPPCRGILTQSELLQNVLLPQSKRAIDSDDKERIGLLCDICLKYVSSLETNMAPATPALDCLTIALLWRLGQAEEAMRMLSARREWQNVLAPKKNTMKDATQLDGALTTIGNESLAEMIIAITTQVAYSEPCKEQFATTAMTHAVDMLSSVSSYQVAAKLLLAAGCVSDAITICQKGVGPARRAASLRQQQQANEQISVVSPRDAPAIGVRAIDFFVAAVDRAKQMPTVGDRARLLLNVHSFITDYDRESLAMSVGQDDELQSALAKEYGALPSDLFHGDDSPVCISLKACFGFPIARVYNSAEKDQ